MTAELLLKIEAAIRATFDAISCDLPLLSLEEMAETAADPGRLADSERLQEDELVAYACLDWTEKLEIAKRALTVR